MLVLDWRLKPVKWEEDNPIYKDYCIQKYKRGGIKNGVYYTKCNGECKAKSK